MIKYNTLELFAGCGGLVEGFEKEGTFDTLACVEWEKPQCENLINRLKTKWNHANAENEVIRFDIQRTEELFNGFNDEEYGSHPGLDKIIGNKKIDVIIGGPPCQAYSVAGRGRDENGMRNDYRNYLFESYIKVVDRYKPKFFIFENVQGMLSAYPDGTPIVSKIRKGFEDIGYIIKDNLNEAVFDLTEYGVPQNRKRVILLGVSQEVFGDSCKEIIEDFYNNVMPSLKTNKVTVKEAIGDLPCLYPLKNEEKRNGKKVSHNLCDDISVHNHEPRFHSQRDIKIFSTLANDIETGELKYVETKALKELYTKMTGHKSNVHKYYVLRWDEQSNTIPAHLYKDGLRHIHPDSKQARSITVREAARLQTFDDDYVFLGSKMNQYKMIGNAVPPRFSYVLAKALHKIINKYC